MIVFRNWNKTGIKVSLNNEIPRSEQFKWGQGDSQIPSGDITPEQTRLA